MTWFDNHAERKLKAPRKTVLEKRGFLVYFTLAYYFLTAYMKVTHLSVEVYLPKEYNEGWEQKSPNNIDIFSYEEKKLNSLVRKPILKHLQR